MIFCICTLGVFNSSSGFGGASAFHVPLPSWVPEKHFTETPFTYLVDFVMPSMTQVVFLGELLYKMTPWWLSWWVHAEFHDNRHRWCWWTSRKSPKRTSLCSDLCPFLSFRLILGTVLLQTLAGSSPLTWDEGKPRFHSNKFIQRKFYPFLLLQTSSECFFHLM